MGIIYRPIAEIILFVLALFIHDEYFGSLILIALMLCIVYGMAERTGVFNER